MAPRERLPGTTVMGESVMPRTSSLPPRAPSSAPPAQAPPRPSLPVRTPSPDAGAFGLRVLGAFALGAGLVSGATSALAVDGTLGIVLATLLTGWGGLSGFFALRAASRRSKRQDARQQTAVEQRVLHLASGHHGVLTATQVARELDMTVDAADAALTKMADGTRVTVEVTDDGIVEYHFRELLATAQRTGVRVDPTAGVSESVVEAPGASDAAKDRGRAGH